MEKAVTRYATIVLHAAATGGAFVTPTAPDPADGEQGGGSPQVTVENESGVARTINPNPRINAA